MSTSKLQNNRFVAGLYFEIFVFDFLDFGHPWSSLDCMIHVNVGLEPDFHQVINLAKSQFEQQPCVQTCYTSYWDTMKLLYGIRSHRKTKL